MQYSSSQTLGQSGFGSLNIQPSVFTELHDEQVTEGGLLEGSRGERRSSRTPHQV